MAELPPDEVIAQAVARVASPTFDRWITLVHAAGCCARPVRLAGTITAVDRATGEARVTYSTAAEPGRVLLKACQTRRATRCPACAAVYQGDARALVIAGLAGGKGVPESVAGHPTVFATFTAPSFGAVHRADPSGRPCHPGAGCRCPQRRLIGCSVVHRSDDPVVGTPICIDCYDYEGTVIWNARATELWARTCNGIRRALARTLAMSVRQFAEDYRLSFAKVVEYQRRGVIHLHAVVRLDQRDGETPAIDAARLVAAVRVAAERAKAPNPLRAAQPIVWGRQVDVEVVDNEGRRAAANYLAKYATKSSDDAGALDRRLHHGDTSRLQLPDHLRRLVDTAWELGGRLELAPLNLHLWAHTLGYRGHWLTKSRHWSTTFAALRDARHIWRQDHERGDGDGSTGDETVAIADWAYTGMGYRTDGDAWLAWSTASNKRLNRRTAWEERS